LTTVGIIGVGQVGSAVARLAVAAGHDVVVSNRRGSGSLDRLVADLGPHARAASVAETATAGPLTVIATPLGAYRELPIAQLAHQVVIDTGNYRPQRDGHIPVLAAGVTTNSELLQRLLTDAYVVKALNNIHAELLPVLARAPMDTERSALAIAGDDVAAKELVAEFLGSLGYDALDIGRLAEGWRLHPGQPAHGIYLPPGAEAPSGAAPVNAAALRVAVAAALRIS
jgi:predicted dinucleotide-binding enzyme